MSHLLALDSGTTSCRSILFDAKLNPVRVAQREFTQYFPQPGWVEHDPREIWEVQRAVAVEAVGDLRSDVAAIGITNQRETIVLWDRVTGEPLSNAIVWQDRRTATACEHLRAEGHETFIRQRTGLALDPYFSATKLAWLLDHLPEARQRAERGELAAGTIETWLLWKLTGGQQHLTDVSNASRTMLMNLATSRWDPELLDLFQIPATLLPTICHASGLSPIDHSTANAQPAPCVVTTIPELAGVPILGLAGDQQAALFGQSCHAAGSIKTTYGTGCFMLLHTGNELVHSQNHLLTTAAASIPLAPPQYALEGSVFVGGAVVQWLRDGLQLIQTSRDIQTLAKSVPDNGGVYFVPAFAGLGAPHWDAGARGMIIGLTRGTTAGHLARAAVESIAHQVADLFEAMQADAHTPIQEMRVDGGAAQDDFLLQFQADLLGIPLIRPASAEITSRGAAWLAGIAAGVSSPASAGDENVSPVGERRFEPQQSLIAVQRQRQRWHEAVRRCRGWDQ